MAQVGGVIVGAELVPLQIMPLDPSSCSLVVVLGPSPTSQGSSSYFQGLGEGSRTLKCLGDRGKKPGPAPGGVAGAGRVACARCVPHTQVSRVERPHSRLDADESLFLPSVCARLGGLSGPGASMQGSAHVGRGSTCTSVSNLSYQQKVWIMCELLREKYYVEFL